MTRTQRVRIKAFAEDKAEDTVTYDNAYSAFFYPLNPPIPKAPYKDYYVCKSCVHSPERTCLKYDKCTSCKQWMRYSINRTRCKCNTVAKLRPCPYYESYKFGYKADAVLYDDITQQRRKQ